MPRRKKQSEGLRPVNPGQAGCLKLPRSKIRNCLKLLVCGGAISDMAASQMAQACKTLEGILAKWDIRLLQSEERALSLDRYWGGLQPASRGQLPSLD